MQSGDVKSIFLAYQVRPRYGDTMQTEQWYYPRIRQYGKPCEDQANYRTFGGWGVQVHIVLTPNAGRTWVGLINPDVKPVAVPQSEPAAQDPETTPDPKPVEAVPTISRPEFDF